MNNGDEETEKMETMDLSMIEEAAEAARAVAEEYDSPYRERVFEVAIKYVLKRTGRTGVSDAHVPVAGARNTLEGLAMELGVDLDGLVRVVDVSDGNIALFGNVEGGSRSERANRACAAYLFLKEQLVGEREADLEELKEVSNSQNPSALDSNFTRNLRKGDYLKEIPGEPGSRDKTYRLLPAGAEVAKEVIRNFVGES